MKTSSYEEHVIHLLLKHKIKFLREKTFNDLKHGTFRFDFYITNPKQALIEVDGQYHFHKIRGRAALLKQQEHDRIKNSWSLAHDIPLYRIPYWEIENLKTFEDLFQDKFLVRSKWHNDNLVPPKTL